MRITPLSAVHRKPSKAVGVNNFILLQNNQNSFRMIKLTAD